MAFGTQLNLPLPAPVSSALAGQSGAAGWAAYAGRTPVT